MSELHAEDQPRARILRSGGAALSDAELVSILLSTGTTLEELRSAQELIREADGIAGLLSREHSAATIDRVRPLANPAEALGKRTSRA